MVNKSCISIKNLSGGYPNKIVLDDFTIEFSKGSFIAIAGPNGAGKSTILKYLIKDLNTNQNKININDKDIVFYSQIDLANQISMVSQFSKTNYDFTVKEIVAMGRYCHKDEISNTSFIEKSLKTVGIDNLADRKITNLSGGEFQLTMLARAICQDTPILALDEPINNLDPNHEIKLLQLLKKLSKEGKTIICVMHDLNAILNYCDQCILVNNGKIFYSGNPNDVLSPENIKEVYKIDSKLINLEDDHKLLTFCCNQ